MAGGLKKHNPERLTLTNLLKTQALSCKDLGMIATHVPALTWHRFVVLTLTNSGSYHEINLSRNKFRVSKD